MYGLTCQPINRSLSAEQIAMEDFEGQVYHAWRAISSSVVNTPNSLVKCRHSCTHGGDCFWRRVPYTITFTAIVRDGLQVCKLNRLQLVRSSGLQPTNLEVAGLPVVAQVQRLRWCERHIKLELHRCILCSERASARVHLDSRASHSCARLRGVGVGRGCCPSPAARDEGKLHPATCIQLQSEQAYTGTLRQATERWRTTG